MRLPRGREGRCSDGLCNPPARKGAALSESVFIPYNVVTICIVPKKRIFNKRMIMSNKNQDHWGSVLADLGLESPLRTEEVRVEQVKPAPPETKVAATDSPGITAAEVTETPRPPVSAEGVTEPPASRSTKRSFLDRFPKINLFGDQNKKENSGKGKPITEGMAFASKKIEKVEVSRGRSERHASEAAATIVDPVVEQKTSEREEAAVKPASVIVTQMAAPWSTIASQVDSLTTTPKTDAKKAEHVVASAASDDAEPRNRRRTPSIFDETVPGESDEIVALRSLIDEADTDPFADSKEKLRSLFDEEAATKSDAPAVFHDDLATAFSTPKTTRRPEDGVREQRREPREERHDRRPRGDRTDRNDRGGKGERMPDRADDWRPRRDDEHRDRREERGERSERSERFSDTDSSVPRKRGTRYSSDEREIQERTWDIEEESKPVERSSRARRRGPRVTDESNESAPKDPRDQRRGRGRRDETATESHHDFHDAHASEESVERHRTIPSWDDAIEGIIVSNIAKHSARPEARHGKR